MDSFYWLHFIIHTVFTVLFLQDDGDPKSMSRDDPCWWHGVVATGNIEQSFICFGAISLEQLCGLLVAANSNYSMLLTASFMRPI